MKTFIEWLDTEISEYYPLLWQFAGEPGFSLDNAGKRKEVIESFIASIIEGQVQFFAHLADRSADEEQKDNEGSTEGLELPGVSLAPGDPDDWRKRFIVEGIKILADEWFSQGNRLCRSFSNPSNCEETVVLEYHEVQERLRIMLPQIQAAFLARLKE